MTEVSSVFPYTFQAEIPLEQILVRSIPKAGKEEAQAAMMLCPLTRYFSKCNPESIVILPANYLKGNKDVLGWLAHGTQYVALRAKYIVGFERICFLLGQPDQKEAKKAIREQSRLSLNYSKMTLTIDCSAEPYYRFTNENVRYFPIGIYHLLPKHLVVEARKENCRLHVAPYHRAANNAGASFSPYATGEPKHFFALTHIPVEFYKVHLKKRCELVRRVYIDLRDFHGLTLYFEQNKHINQEKACTNILELFDSMRVLHAEWHSAKKDLVYLPLVPRLPAVESNISVYKIPLSLSSKGQQKQIKTVEEALSWTTREEKEKLICKYFPSPVTSCERELTKRFQAAREGSTSCWVPGACRVIHGNEALCFLPPAPQM